ncbi:FKBP-type peptidyl-prolyl cis-trans isomerase [Psychromicrobium xiongbiense]|uniref:FKBP-type peptidyl-prolyl cis-trans isomerase n=1 Tax=Psychromicrobium xiongbiense TaxID=3051184 RepID=UPI0025541AA8|nr:FKBP-type peptidyl-prolyl cis-trans isomerase [Psychromicrobium sp. YIM S02556]
MRRSRALAAILIPLALLLAACGNGSSASSSSSTAAASASVPAANADLLKDVKLTPAAAGQAPTLDFPKPLAIDKAAAKIAVEGTGAVIKGGQQVTLRQVAVQASDGTALGETFSAASGDVVVLNSDVQQNAPLFYSLFVGAKVGTYVLFGAPAQSANGQTQPAAVGAFYLESAKDILMPTDQVNQLDAAGKLPQVTFDDKGTPSVKIPAVDAPTSLVVKVLKDSTGDPVQASNKVNAYYTGWTWADGKQFDTSYGKPTPFNFSLSQVIKGWTYGLVGQRVGSTVLLVIPADLAYGSTPSNGQPAGPLVFVVKITSKA